MEFGLPAITILFILPIFVAHYVWTKKGGSPAVGIALGVFLGWVGVVVAFFATPTGPPEGSDDRGWRGP